ncbi:cuticle protein 12.5-like [Stegodyphus dumicola]|uniref:cuticle protein 12.5-like n=1 Tax=Stegodyphus dumicola TaxID=202533 RepID=UPI0015B144BA|nr:cuticle protein 12.5-like [Stegodyphus dumicola]
MIAKVVFLCAAFAAVTATGYVSPAIYGTGLALKAPAAPILAAPLLSRSVIASPASYSIQRSVVSHGVSPVAVAAAPLTYTALAKVSKRHCLLPLAYTTVAKTAPVAYGAPILSHTGLLGAAPLAYSDILGHGLAYTTGAGHSVTYTSGLAGHDLAYGSGVLGLSKIGYGKVLL